jgi:hypothetical protein
MGWRLRPVRVFDRELIEPWSGGGMLPLDRGFFALLRRSGARALLDRRFSTSSGQASAIGILEAGGRAIKTTRMGDSADRIL